MRDLNEMLTDLANVYNGTDQTGARDSYNRLAVDLTNGAQADADLRRLSTPPTSEAVREAVAGLAQVSGDLCEASTTILGHHNFSEAFRGTAEEFVVAADEIDGYSATLTAAIPDPAQSVSVPRAELAAYRGVLRDLGIDPDSLFDGTS